MDIYAEHILDHYRHPRGKKRLPDASVSHGEHNPACGDEVTLDLRIADGVIAGIGWDGHGCAISQAAMSMLTEELPGKPLDAIGAMKAADVLELLGVPISARRRKCALLPLHALKNALRKNAGQKAQSWAETLGEEIDN